MKHKKYIIVIVLSIIKHFLKVLERKSVREKVIHHKSLFFSFFSKIVPLMKNLLETNLVNF